MAPGPPRSPGRTSRSRTRAHEGTTYEASCYTDPLALEHLTGSLGATIAWMGRWAADAQLRFTTKFAAVEPLLAVEHHSRTRMRASINVLGPLVARCGSARVALPGGDAIGSRGLDMHISGLERLGATIVSEHGFLVATAPRLTGTSIWLDFPSVGATENLVTAAVLAAGTTVIDNAAREPEILDLCSMLVAMGARIDGAGTSTIESKTNFFRGLREGALHATSTPLHVGRTTIVIQTDLVDDRGKHVARVTQTQAVLAPS